MMIGSKLLKYLFKQGRRADVAKKTCAPVLLPKCVTDICCRVKRVTLADKVEYHAEIVTKLVIVIDNKDFC
jgi:hypothetical protein